MLYPTLNYSDLMIQPGEKHTVNALKIAYHRGCERAGVEPFKPYDLRRSTATCKRRSKRVPPGGRLKSVPPVSEICNICR